MATKLIDFQTHRLRRESLSAALGAYIAELQAEGLTLDTPLSVGAVLADVARLAGVEPPPQVAEWLEKALG